MPRVLGLDEIPLAQRLFAAQAVYGKIEDELSSVLERLYGHESFEVSFDFTIDAYDESIEIYGVTPTATAWAELRERGFMRIWQHDHPNDDDRSRGVVCGCSSSPP